MEQHSRSKKCTGCKAGKIFQKISREIYMAAKAGGPDSNINPALRLVMDKAKSANMPNDNMMRAIKKATALGEGEHYDEITYEGYGPGGVAILVRALTDNRNRTATNVRVAFTRNGGNLGETGSVNYMFDRQGYIVIERKTILINEEEMLEKVIDSGAEDMVTSPEFFEIYTSPEDFTNVRDQLEAEGFTLAQAELTMIPQITIKLDEQQKQQLEHLVDKLEDDEDVSEVFTSAE